MPKPIPRVAAIRSYPQSFSSHLRQRPVPATAPQVDRNLLEQSCRSASRYSCSFSEHQKRIYAAEINLARRQLTGAQKTKLGMAIEPNIAAEAKARMQHKDPKTGENTYGRLPVGVGSHPQTRDEVAGKVGVGAGVTYQRHKKVLEQLAKEPDGAQLMEHIESGKVTGDQDPVEDFPQGRGPTTRDEIAEKLGIGSGVSYNLGFI